MQYFQAANRVFRSGFRARWPGLYILRPSKWLVRGGFEVGGKSPAGEIFPFGDNNQCVGAVQRAIAHAVGKGDAGPSQHAGGFVARHGS